MLATKLVYQGEEFTSLNALSKHVGIPRSSLTKQLDKTADVDLAVSNYFAKKNKKIMVNNVSFTTLTDVATHFGLAYKALSYRVSKLKETPEQAVHSLQQDKSVEFRGKTYRNLSDLCSEYNMSIAVVFTRLQTGKTLEEALTTPKKKRNMKTSLVYRDKEYTSKADLCDSYGISFSLVNTLVNSRNLEWLTAFDMVNVFFSNCEGKRPNILSYIPCLIINGVWYRSTEDFCKDYNISSSLFTMIKSRLTRIHEKEIGNMEVIGYLNNKMETLYVYKNKTYRYEELPQASVYWKQLLDNNAFGLKHVKKYTDIRVPMRGYCRDTQKDFERYIWDYSHAQIAN